MYQSTDKHKIFTYFYLPDFCHDVNRILQNPSLHCKNMSVSIKSQLNKKNLRTTCLLCMKHMHAEIFYVGFQTYHLNVKFHQIRSVNSWGKTYVTHITMYSLITQILYFLIRNIFQYFMKNSYNVLHFSLSSLI